MQDRRRGTVVMKVKTRVKRPIMASGDGFIGASAQEFRRRPQCHQPGLKVKRKGQELLMGEKDTE
jgi:hypothetical protein